MYEMLIFWFHLSLTEKILRICTIWMVSTSYTIIFAINPNEDRFCLPWLHHSEAMTCCLIRHSLIIEWKFDEPLSTLSDSEKYLLCATFKLITTFLSAYSCCMVSLFPPCNNKSSLYAPWCSVSLRWVTVSSLTSFGISLITPLYFIFVTIHFYFVCVKSPETSDNDAISPFLFTIQPCDFVVRHVTPFLSLLAWLTTNHQSYLWLSRFKTRFHRRYNSSWNPSVPFLKIISQFSCRSTSSTLSFHVVWYFLLNDTTHGMIWYKTF